MKQTQIKTGLIIKSILLLLSILFSKYDVVRIETIIDIFLIPCLAISLSILFRLYKNKNNHEKVN
ncbi:hypothetical protein SAMN04489761_3245 [Tenacibaculum sp. MAR_2009_124]|nr:hypothetical protein SAMN04489761_3245 [Tenacibaculum sp. MAR_2009_124]